MSALAYAYTDGMNLTGITDTLTADNNNTLWYTAANRLQNANGPWGNTTNYYDLVGNRTYNINTVGAATTERIQTYAANSNRLNAITENTAAFRSYTYDNAGNTLTETRPGESFAYTYNKRNRLASVTRNSIAYASYTYNALEQLTSRNTQAVGAPAGTVHYIYDNDNHLIAEANASTGAITRDYIWLASNDNDPIDLPLAIAESATLTMVHADHLGRPTRMTNAAKATVWQATWKPWGEVHQLSGTLTQNLRFPGQYFQIETGLHYNHHRIYDPITGRYTQADPLRFVDGPSVYAYAGNSPYMNTDRDGQIIQRVVVGAAIGAGFDLGVQLYNNGGRLECVNWGSVGRSALIGAGLNGLLGLRFGATVVTPPNIVMHHSVPRAVLGRLPNYIANNPMVRGATGKPNRFGVPENLHKAAHSSPRGNQFPGGNYNRDFFKEIDKAGGMSNITPQQVRNIANQLMNKYF